MALLFLFIFAPLAYASTGTITSPNQYAWGNVAGWINFAPPDSPITVSNSSLTGYAWSVNDGWINLSPTNGGVTNSNGTLGGWAWDETAGWVSFSDVTINSAGTFVGEATGANGYAINFNCSACNVQTTWRPTSTVPSSPGSLLLINPGPSVQPPVTLSPASPPAATQSPVVTQPTAHSKNGLAPSVPSTGPILITSVSSSSAVRGASSATSTTPKRSTLVSILMHHVVIAGTALILLLAILALGFFF